MAVTNAWWVGKAMESLKAGIAPFSPQEFIRHYQGRTTQEIKRILSEPRQDARRPFHHMDAAGLLRVMWESWNEVYRNTLGHAERSLVSELRDVRNREVSRCCTRAHDV